MNLQAKPLLALSLLACSFAAQAIPLSLNEDDSYLLGDIQFATPSSAQQEVNFFTTLLFLGPNDTVTISGNGSLTVITRSANVFSGLPEPELPGDGEKLDETLIDLSGGWQYVYGKYGNDAYVWYVGELSGSVEIPAEIEGSGGLSHRSLYSNRPPGGGGVPDGGTTIALLGTGLLGLATVRRSLAR